MLGCVDTSHSWAPRIICHFVQDPVIGDAIDTLRMIETVCTRDFPVRTDVHEPLPRDVVNGCVGRPHLAHALAAMQHTPTAPAIRSLAPTLRGVLLGTRFNNDARFKMIKDCLNNGYSPQRLVDAIVANGALDKDRSKEVCHRHTRRPPFYSLSHAQVAALIRSYVHNVKASFDAGQKFYSYHIEEDKHVGWRVVPPTPAFPAHEYLAAASRLS